MAATVLAAGLPIGFAAWAGASPHPDAKAAALAGDGLLSFQPLLGLPASGVAMIGAAPQEAAGATWAQGHVGAVPAVVGSRQISGGEDLLHYTSQSGTWQVVPLDDSEGRPLSFDWSASEVTPQGGVVLGGHDEQGQESLITRDPAGAFSEALVPSAGEPAGGKQADAAGEQKVLEVGEELYASGPPLIAALAEADGHTGALVAPVRTAAAKGSPVVLHYDGTKWTREPLCESYTASTCTPASETLAPLALSASSSDNAWLAESTGANSLVLFQRVAESDGQEAWVRRSPTNWLLGGAAAPLGGAEKAAPIGSGPLLTAVGQGVWVDLRISLSTSSGTSTGNGTVLVSPEAGGEAAGTFCYPTSMCPGDGSLGAPLPSDYGSFAWAGAGAGTRIITGLSDGVMLTLDEGASEFVYTVGDGAGGRGPIGPGGETEGGQAGGAAFSSPDEGWLGESPAQGSAPQVIHVTAKPTASALTSWPVPFRRPLLAVAGQPGSTPGEAGAEALAVGAEGEVARYIPGEGWTPEYLYNGNGERETPTLRGVAWPQAEHAYAVGDEGAMWRWQAYDGLWQPDPGTPFGFHGNLTAIAFSPSNPNIGYAVGKQGVLLAYGKTWTQQPLPAGLSEANFTSIAFAGNEAIATYSLLDPSKPGKQTGGLIVNDGSGWQVEPSAQALLASLPEQDETILSKIAGLPDGGAVAAGPKVVIERDSADAPWRFSSEPLGEAQNIAALAAFQEGGSVRALAAIETESSADPNNSLIYEGIDAPPPPAEGQPKLLIGPDPLPESSYLLRETASGWQDVDGDDEPEAGLDLPEQPDPVLALLIDPVGDQGWAVGGQTGEQLAQGEPGAQVQVQTAGAMRYGPGPEPPTSTSAPITTPSGQATFALGGDAQCAQACANLVREGPGADTWLTAAIARASEIQGLHAFLYAGPHLATSADGLEAPAFERELESYASLLGTDGSLPVYAAASSTDVGASSGGVSAFTRVLGAHAPAGSHPPGTPPPPEGSAAYAFESPGAGGAVRVIVLDYSGGEALSSGDENQPSCPASPEGSPADQLQWLCAQLQDARASGVPAIVVGNDNITDPGSSNYAAEDAPAVRAVLLSQGASAYLFESPEENLSEVIGGGADSIPAYGSGTLGYVRPPLYASSEAQFHGASGFLLANVNVAARNPADNRAPVDASLTVNAGQLALDATNGTLLRRSQVALFEGLARRPAGGAKDFEGFKSFHESEAPDPYTALPERCFGASCNTFIAPTYTFTSSKPDIGNFVEQDPNNTNPRAVLQGANGMPIPDSNSGLFCAYNAGTTIVTITAGGLSYSEPVTVQQGSVEQPCGTVPLTNPPAAEEAQASAPPPPPPINPAPGFTPLGSLVPPPPPAKAPIPHHPARIATTPQLPIRAAALYPILSPPLPAAPVTPQPTPPSGTATVTQAVGAAEREEEVEGAYQHVHNMAVYDHRESESVPIWSVALIVIAAAAAAGVRPRRGREEPVYAWARRSRKRSYE